MPLGVIKRRQWIFIGLASLSVIFMVAAVIGRWSLNTLAGHSATTISKRGDLSEDQDVSFAAKSLRKPGAVFEIQFSNILERGRGDNRSADLRLSIRALESVKDVKLKWNFPEGFSLKRGDAEKNVGHLTQGESFVTDISVSGDASQPRQVWVEVVGDQDGQRVGVVENHLPFKEWRTADENSIRELNRRFRSLNGPDAEAKAQR